MLLEDRRRSDHCTACSQSKVQDDSAPHNSVSLHPPTSYAPIHSFETSMPVPSPPISSHTGQFLHTHPFSTAIHDHRNDGASKSDVHSSSPAPALSAHHVQMNDATVRNMSNACHADNLPSHLEDGYESHRPPHDPSKDELNALHQLDKLQKKNFTAIRPQPLSSSHTFPPSDGVPSSTLDVMMLGGMKRHHTELDADVRLQSTNSAPSLQPNKQASAPSHSPPSGVLRPQASDGSGSMNSLKRPELHDQAQVSAHPSLSDMNIRQRHASNGGALVGIDREDNIPDRNSYHGSSQSDGLTVTEDYLQGVVQHKRHLRKVSHNQQQQLQYLQARVHMSSNPSRSSLGSADGHTEVHNQHSGTISRPSSRLSTHGSRTKLRSRTGSYSVHDSIPISKDDVFGICHSESTIRRPLGHLDLNNGRNGAASALELRHYGEASNESDASAIDEVLAMNSHSSLSPPDATTQNVDDDPKGAHRRLYLRLRNELSTPDIVRFERYVHRYDALEIGMEGSRGIINRVRRLLLPEDVVKSKLSQPDKYKFRKELAREFERIVREDAVPVAGVTETDNSQAQQSMVQHMGDTSGASW